MGSDGGGSIYSKRVMIWLELFGVNKLQHGTGGPVEVNLLYKQVPLDGDHVPHPSNGQKMLLTTRFRRDLPMVLDGVWFQEFGWWHVGPNALTRSD